MASHALRLVALAALASLVGCASHTQIPRRESGLIVGTQGAGSEVVFPGVEIAALVAGQGDGPEFARRDYTMNIRADMPATAFEADAWPAAPVPTLDDARYLYLPRTTNQYLYFNTVWPAARRSFYWYGY